MKKTWLMFVGLSAGLLAGHAFSQNKISLDRFKYLSKQSIRCSKLTEFEIFIDELKYAFSKKLIDQNTFEWAVAHHYYPVFRKRGTEIGGVCKFHDDDDSLLPMSDDYRDYGTN